jgi:hypothetical protein
VNVVSQRLLAVSYSLTDTASMSPKVIGGSSILRWGNRDSATNP